MIDEHAIIDPSAKIANDVIIEPFAVIGKNVEIGSGTWVGSHAVIKGSTRIGQKNKIFQFSSIGEDPQDQKYKGEETWLEIGDRNIFREYCTVNRGTALDQGVTSIGDDNLFMAYVHVAHDCRIANHTIFANNATLAGHVHIDDYVILGGFSGIHQFCHLGKHSFISAGSIVIKDVLPYTRVSGSYAKPFGLNIEGLRRCDFSMETIRCLKEAYKIIYRQNLTTADAIEKLKTMLTDCPEVLAYIELLEKSTRGIVR